MMYLGIFGFNNRFLHLWFLYYKFLFQEKKEYIHHKYGINKKTQTKFIIDILNVRIYNVYIE